MGGTTYSAPEQEPKKEAVDQLPTGNPTEGTDEQRDQNVEEPTAASNNDAKDNGEATTDAPSTDSVAGESHD